MKSESRSSAAFDQRSNIRPAWAFVIDVSPYLAGILIALLLAWLDIF